MMQDTGSRIPDEAKIIALVSGAWADLESGISYLEIASVSPRSLSFDPARHTSHNPPMSRFSIWLPELARKQPGKNLILSYQVPAGESPEDAEQRIGDALRRSELTGTRDDTSTWRATLPWRTRVFGLIPRDVDEDVTFRIEQHPDHWELRVNCHPLETHGAHAAGFAGVLFLAASVWIASGIATGVVAALATILAGTLVVEVTRQWAFDALEGRLRILAKDLGRALWPGRPAQIVALD